MEADEHIARGGRMDAAGYLPVYMSGFGNAHASEAETGALPIGRNSPQIPPLGLYAEQVNGTAFTAPRASNRRSWLYRIRPSVCHAAGDFRAVDHPFVRTAPCRDESTFPAGQMRWGPVTIPAEPTDFLDGLRTMTTCGDAWTHDGMAAHVYVANRSMEQRYLVNADGEMMILPQTGAVRLVTEFGLLVAGPGELVILPRGVKFRVDLVDTPVRGYVCENYGTCLSLPERGPIGANGLADARDFLYPAAAYEDRDGQPASLYMKWLGGLYRTEVTNSPLDVVAWHGNYAPCKYDLRRFATIGSISFDHPDPSIFTVLTSASHVPGTANVDVVIFPERWLVMEDTFRPPWYHTNVMSEFMGLLHGVYDAKPSGLVPGGMSLHNAMFPHGPDAQAFEAARTKELKPEKLRGTLAFMFETRLRQNLTAFASDRSLIDADYRACWSDLRRRFKTEA